MIIKAPSRIHMSLIDLNGSYRRIDGGIGLALAEPQFILEIQKRDDNLVTLEFSDNIDDDEAILECSEKIPTAAEKTRQHFNIEDGFNFIVHQTYPPHSGFGSGTQIAVSTAHLITETMGIEVESRELSSIVGRGGTSGIGTYTHDLGGFILDGGHSVEEKPGFLPSGASNGQDEVNVFQDCCPIPRDEVEKVSHLILMNLVPFMLEKDIKNFGWAVSELQKVGFNKLEHSLDDSYLPTMKAIEEAGAYGVGISSFGPVLYTIFDESNEDIVEKTKEIIGENGTVFVTKAQNHGFVIEK